MDGGPAAISYVGARANATDFSDPFHDMLPDTVDCRNYLRRFTMAIIVPRFLFHWPFKRTTEHTENKRGLFHPVIESPGLHPLALRFFLDIQPVTLVDTA